VLRRNRGRGKEESLLVTGQAHVGVGITGVSGQNGADEGAHSGPDEILVSLSKTYEDKQGRVVDSLGETGGATPAAGAVDGRSLTNSHGAVGADVVLVGTVLATLGGDTLELLLGRGVGVPNLHDETLFADGDTVKALDDLLTDITGLEAVLCISLLIGSEG